MWTLDGQCWAREYPGSTPTHPGCYRTPTPIRAQWTLYSSTAYRWIQVLVLPHSLPPPSEHSELHTPVQRTGEYKYTGTPTLTPTPMRTQWTPYSSTAYRWIQIYWCSHTPSNPHQYNVRYSCYWKKQYSHIHSHPHQDTVNSILLCWLQVTAHCAQLFQDKFTGRSLIIQYLFTFNYDVDFTFTATYLFALYCTSKINNRKIGKVNCLHNRIELFPALFWALSIILAHILQ